jgi:tetratricopeptide (TPR) repeat protein
LGGSGEDFGNSIQGTSDGGFIITGTKDAYRSNESAWLIKVDSQGNELWNKTFIGRGWGNDAIQTSDGGYIIAAQKSGDIQLIKTDSNGNILFEKTFSGLSYESPDSVQQTSDEGYIIAGMYNEEAPWLIKTDPNGNELWNKTFAYGGASAFGGGANSVQQTDDGGYIFFVVFNLVKTDSHGEELWNRTLSKITIEDFKQTADKGYIVTGNGDFYRQNEDASSTANQAYVSLIKTDSLGNEEWNRTIADRYYAKAVLQTTDGGYIIAGDAWLIKTDSNGNTIWDRAFGRSDYHDRFRSIQQTSDGGYIVVGDTTYRPAVYGSAAYDADNYNVWLIKTDPAGNVFSINYQDAEACLNKGNSLFDQGMYDEAMQAYNNALEIYPEFTGAWFKKGMLYSHIGNQNEAINAFNKAIELDPNDSATWYNKALALYDSGKKDEATLANIKAKELKNRGF